MAGQQDRLVRNYLRMASQRFLREYPHDKMAAYIQQVFNIDLGSNLSRTLGEMRLRNDPTPYLDSMTDALLRKMKRTKIKR